MPEINIREAKREDCPRIRMLIQELADFEKMPDGPKIDAKILERDGFDTEPPLFQCFVVEDGDQLVGYALYNMAYSTWQGKRFWLEDIGILESHRHEGIGTKLMLRIIKRAADLECNVMNFNVLGWNPAEKFYKKFGAEDLTDTENWHFYTIPKHKIEEISSKGQI